MGAIIIVDALWGDSGKGKVAAFLSRREDAPLCLRAGIGTNAGHSVYLTEENSVRTRQLPLGFLHPATRVGMALSDTEIGNEALLLRERRQHLRWRRSHPARP